MKKRALSVLLISLALLCFVASPVMAKNKRVKLEDLKACAQESLALSCLDEEYDRARKRSKSLYKKAERLYNNIESKKNKLDEMDGESQEEIDQHNELVEKINGQTDGQRKAVKKSKRAATKQNILKAKINIKRVEYNDNCTNLRFKRKDIRLVCGKNGEYKDTDFCENI